MLSFLKGKRTYLIALVAAALAAANSLGYVVPEWVFIMLASLGLTTTRAAIGR